VTNTPPSDSASHSGIGVRWAEEKIAALLDEKVRGRPEAEVREAVLEVALQHQLMSPYTSFVAVEETPSRPQDQAVAQAPVPNLLPQGQQAAPLMYPRTSTSLLLNWLLGSCALVVLMVLRRWRAVEVKHG
jgi:Ca-activated chloride channel family protein